MPRTIVLLLALIGCSDDAPGSIDARRATDGPGYHSGAEARPGGLDRVLVFGGSDEGPCVQLTLVNPGSVGLGTITVPAPWAVESGAAGALQPCSAMPLVDEVSATGGTGTISFGPLGGGYPCSVDVSVVLHLTSPSDQAPIGGTMIVSGTTGC